MYSMRDNPLSHVLAALLVLVQLVVGPFAHASPLAVGGADCAGVASTQGSTHDHPIGHGALSVVEDASGGDGSHSCRTHLACACPCAHTPALGVTRVVLQGCGSVAAVTGPLAGPAFDAPLFDFLRPPD